MLRVAFYSNFASRTGIDGALYQVWWYTLAELLGAGVAVQERAPPTSSSRCECVGSSETMRMGHLMLFGHGPVASTTRVFETIFPRALADSNETFCLLNHQRELTLPRLSAAPTSTSSKYRLTLHFLWHRQGTAEGKLGKDVAGSKLGEFGLQCSALFPVTRQWCAVPDGACAGAQPLRLHLTSYQYYHTRHVILIESRQALVSYQDDHILLHLAATGVPPVACARHAVPERSDRALWLPRQARTS